MRRNQIPGKHEETRGKKRRKRNREKETEEKTASVSAYFSANIPVRAMLNCIFNYNQCMDMC